MKRRFLSWLVPMTGILLLLPVVVIACQLQAPTGVDSNLLAVAVGAAEPCREIAKDTSPDYQCERPTGHCVEKAPLSVTVGLSVQGGVVVISGGGQVSVTFQVPTGCDGYSVWKQPCAKRTGVQETPYSGDVKKLRKKNCSGAVERVCIDKVGTFTVTLPAGVIQQLEELFHVNLPDNVTIPYPCVYCEGDTTQQTSIVCPGTNGGQTWYEIVDETCP